MPNHAGNLVTHSHTGILLFVQNSPILVWLTSQRQKIVETTFGSDFVALRTEQDMIIAIRYKLHMFGVILDGPAHVF